MAKKLFFLSIIFFWLPAQVDSMVFQDWEKHVIGTLTNPIYVYVKDIDGDGDLDVATTTNIHPGAQPSDVAWFQNNLNQGQPWGKFLIRGRDDPDHLNATMGIIVEDMDGDTHEDVVVATGVINLDGTGPHGEVHWFKAPADPALPGATWEDFTVNSTDTNIYAKVYTMDANEDGAEDIIVSGEMGAVLFLNPGNPDQPGDVWEAIPLPAQTGVGMYLDDMNGDGKMDVINSVRGVSGNVSWIDVLYDNATDEITFERTMIEELIDSPFDPCSIDVKKDLRKDVIVSAVPKESQDFGCILWYEAPASTGNPWIQHTVAEIKAADVYPGDIDRDGKSDFVTAAIFERKVSWFKYEVNSGEVSWTENVIDDDIDLPGDISLDDVDGDGDLDVVTTAYYGVEVVWYENKIPKATVCPIEFLLGEDSPHLLTLRILRDNYLAAVPGGKWLVESYYAHSQGILEFSKGLKNMISFLNKF